MINENIKSIQDTQDTQNTQDNQDTQDTPCPSLVWNKVKLDYIPLKEYIHSIVDIYGWGVCYTRLIQTYNMLEYSSYRINLGISLENLIETINQYPNQKSFINVFKFLNENIKTYW